MTEVEMPNIEDYRSKEDGFDYDGFSKANRAYQNMMKLKMFEKAIIDDYGIDEDSWSKTPEVVKAILARLHEKAEEHEEMVYALEDWRDNMPI